MKKLLFAATLALFASTQAFAILGIGAHYVMNTGSLDGNKGQAYGLPTDPVNIGVEQKKAEGFQGIGFKAWIDFLPVVDIEGTLNVAATRYGTILNIHTPIKDTIINLTYTPDAPYSMIFGEASPLFGVVNGDVSVTYPFDLLPIIRPYVGAGVSYFASIPIVNASFAKKMLDNNKALTDALTDPTNPDYAKAASKIGESLVNTLEKESYTTGIGGHIVAGLRIKPPVIPLAVYANCKRYFGGSTNSQFSQGFVFELGGGFAL